jgi:hypothetical protein
MPGPALLSIGLILAAAPSAMNARDVACVVDQLTPAESRLIRGSLNDPATQHRLAERLGAAQRVCMDRYGWDLPRLNQISMMVVAALVSREMAADLAADGIEVAAIDRWFARQEDRFQVGAFIDMDEAQAWAILDTLKGREVRADLMARNRDTIRTYVQSKAVAERSARGLPDPPAP